MATFPLVLVIGAGVIGLSTAVTLAEAGYPVFVRTAEPPEATTSAVAGALWGPWLVQPRNRVLRWAEHTLTTLRHLATHRDTGVRLASGVDVSDVRRDPPDWAYLLPDCRPCTPEELPAGYAYGTRCTVPLVDMPTYLTYLTHRLTAAGGRIQIEPVASLDDVAHSSPLIVNCAGLGAHALVPDNQVHPVRGHHVIVTNPGLTDFAEADTGDSHDLIAIYPHLGHVVLGGTAEPGKWDRDPDPATGQAILERCTRLEPRLADAQVIDHLIGLRPTRPYVRVDLQHHPSGATVAHNYGHGGAGVSLSWGCATEITDLISTANIPTSVTSG
ncbi:MAG: FAD-dependent oxidoreductase [Pseudonocardiaceae bacterium]